MKNKIKHPFNEVEILEIMEIARLALNDACLFDEVVEDSDLSDDYLKSLKEKLDKFMASSF